MRFSKGDSVARAAAVLGLLTVAHASAFDVNSDDSIKSAAANISRGVLSYYSGNQTGQVPGLLNAPYYWWEGAGMFDTLIQYWHVTGDAQYNDLIAQGMLFQIGSNNDYMPVNQTNSLGNDDQATWALAAMTAAELKLPQPAGAPSWLSLAQAVFDTQVQRWDTATCGGGLRWQIFAFNSGYSYKNSLTNGDFFQLAARLARYTANTTYYDWANTAYDWSTNFLVDDHYRVFDGSQTTSNCTSVNRVQWSATAGTYITGAAHMYNATNGVSKWQDALNGLLNQTLGTFFTPADGTGANIMYEVACEKSSLCNTDQLSFKAFLATWLAATIQTAPYTKSVILPKLQASAIAAVAACTDGLNCDATWLNGHSSNVTTGLGQQLSALAVVQSLLVFKSEVYVNVTFASHLSDPVSTTKPATPTSTSTITGTAVGSNSTTSPSALVQPNNAVSSYGMAAWGTSVASLAFIMVWLLV